MDREEEEHEDKQIQQEIAMEKARKEKKKVRAEPTVDELKQKFLTQPIKSVSFN